MSIKDMMRQQSNYDRMMRNERARDEQNFREYQKIWRKRDNGNIHVYQDGRVMQCVTYYPYRIEIGDIWDDEWKDKFKP